MSGTRSFRGVAMRLIDREFAGHGRPLARNRIDPDLAAMQFDKGTHQRQAEARAAMPRAVGMTLEPVEHLVLHLRRDAGSAIAHRAPHAAARPPRPHSA